MTHFLNKIVSVCTFVMMLPSTSLAFNNSGVNCDISNTPVDCKRLTAAECEQAKREQEILNLNRQLFCQVQDVSQAVAANASGGGAGSGTGEGSGNGGGEGGASEAGEAGEGNEASQEGEAGDAGEGNNAGQEGEAGDAGEGNEASQEGETSNESGAAEQADASAASDTSESEPTTTTPNSPPDDSQSRSSTQQSNTQPLTASKDDRGDGPQWGNGALCEKFKSAYEKAQSTESQQLIEQQAASSGCK